jgi:hypothetical protein
LRQRHQVDAQQQGARADDQNGKKWKEPHDKPVSI